MFSPHIRCRPPPWSSKTAERSPSVASFPGSYSKHAATRALLVVYSNPLANAVFSIPAYASPYPFCLVHAFHSPDPACMAAATSPAFISRHPQGARRKAQAARLAGKPRGHRDVSLPCLWSPDLDHLGMLTVVRAVVILCARHLHRTRWSVRHPPAQYARCVWYALSLGNFGL